MFGVTYHNIWSLENKYTNSAWEAEDYSVLDTVGLDQIAARCGDDYVTFFVDMEEILTLNVTVGKNSEMIENFHTNS